MVALPVLLLQKKKTTFSFFGGVKVSWAPCNPALIPHFPSGLLYVSLSLNTGRRWSFLIGAVQPKKPSINSCVFWTEWRQVSDVRAGVGSSRMEDGLSVNWFKPSIQHFQRSWFFSRRRPVDVQLKRVFIAAPLFLPGDDVALWLLSKRRLEYKSVFFSFFLPHKVQLSALCGFVFADIHRVHSQMESSSYIQQHRRRPKRRQLVVC